MNRAGRSKDVTDYIEERWPGLEALAADYPRDGSGYSLMASIALAYRQQGETARFEQAIGYVEQALNDLAAEGINQFVFMLEQAKYHALAGDNDAALAWLEKSVAAGLQTYAPLAKNLPELASLEDDPRFIEIEATMIANVNEDRAALELEPVDPYLAFWQQPVGSQ